MWPINRIADWVGKSANLAARNCPAVARGFAMRVGFGGLTGIWEGKSVVAAAPALRRYTAEYAAALMELWKVTHG